MYDLKDVTFMIPVRIRDEDRLNNVRLVTRYLNNYFDTNIIVCESDSKQVLKESDVPGCRYIYLQDDTEVFHRTRILNYMTRQSTTPYIVNCDTDVLLNVENYVFAANILRENKGDFVFPYGGNFYNIPKELHSRFYNMIIKGIEIISVKSHECTLVHNKSVGGIIFMNKQSFIDCGMENENFVSWGVEDLERVERWRKLDKVIGRSSGDLYHLDHRAYPAITLDDNKKEFNKVHSMSNDELIEYIKTWDWLK
jgi:predicted glycosyltransferase involved in capsule biosynthesis